MLWFIAFLKCFSNFFQYLFKTNLSHFSYIFIYLTAKLDCQASAVTKTVFYKTVCSQSAAEWGQVDNYTQSVSDNTAITCENCNFVSENHISIVVYIDWNSHLTEIYLFITFFVSTLSAL